jgi:hypothetical protein
MTKDIEKQNQQKLAELLEERRRLLSMPAEKALDEILDAPNALPLVHSFSEEDFFFLINDIGLEDALPILSMASLSQWEYILDVEVWEKDRISLKPVLKWFELLLKADADRFVQWLQDEKLELFEFCLLKTIEVRMREHDEDPADFGEDFFTFDDIYYIRYMDSPFNESQDTAVGKEKEEIVFSLLKRLAAVDHVLYQGILHEYVSMLSSETEEEIYRLRNVRMAEKGFLPSEEAIGIYQPLHETTKINIQKRMAAPGNVQKNIMPLSIYPVSVLNGDDLFSTAMNRIDSSQLFSELESEFVVLCNTIISADQKIIRERGELSEIVTKACGYISIGLQHLSGSAEKSQIDSLISLISDYPLSHLFKTGYGLVLELKWRADRWQRKSWVRENGLPLGFWGEEWLGVLGGLLLKRPLCFDNYETGKLYREFRSLADIRMTEDVLSEVICFDTLFSLLAIPFEPVFHHFVTYRNSLLTLWARNQLGLDAKLLPIEIVQFRSFFQSIFEVSPGNQKEGVPSIKPRRRQITTAAKTVFVDWISTKTGLTNIEVTKRYGSIFDRLFKEIENEYGSVSVKNLDPRYVHLFLLQQSKKESGHP